jgi:hypothetical protein
MAKFNLDDYELVEDRIEKFWKDNPDGKIHTKITENLEDGTMVIIHASIYEHKDDAEPKATGIAQEYKGVGFANTTSWVENCETSAIGRALANWKYKGNKKARPSREEMQKVASGESSESAQQSIPKKKPEPVNQSNENPVEILKDAGFGNKRVKHYTKEEKTKPRSPDFRCQAFGDCTAGDTVDGKVFAKSWWLDSKDTPDSWKDYAAAKNGIKLPDPKTLSEGDLPF